MQKFNGIQWSAINVANSYGLDKLTYDLRLKWVKENLHCLEELANQADDKFLYIKAVDILRQAQIKQPTGAFVFLDASASGLQVLSALAGCTKGAKLTNITSEDHRFDAYTEVTDKLNERLGTSMQVPRKRVKEAVMVTFYGGMKLPAEIFGSHVEDFYEVCKEMFPGAWELLQLFVKSWDSNALVHQWVLPDNHNAYIPTMKTVEYFLPVHSLEHQMRAIFKENRTLKHSVANAANLTHSVDAYILRSMVRRCSYDKEIVTYANKCLREHLERSRSTIEPSNSIKDLVDIYNETKLADVSILPLLNDRTVRMLPTELVNKLLDITDRMLAYKPFDIVTVHDAFGCHPNNCDQMRYWYKEILAEIAESDLCQFLLRQMYKVNNEYDKHSNNLADEIRLSNYAIS